MFGIGGDEKKINQLAGIINGMMDRFDAAIAVTAGLLGRGAPVHGDTYLAILLGFADACGQAGQVDMTVTRKALQRLLSHSSDGDQVFQKMLRLSNDRRYFEWQMLGGRAAEQTIQTNGQSGPLMKLAESYLDAS